MNFSWDDPTKTHPIWPRNSSQFPTLMVSSHQKNKKAQEIPMLPGLQALLEKVPAERRRGWVANPLPLERKGSTGEPPPFADDLRSLTRDYSNISIAKAFNVTEAAVRKWLSKAKIERQNSPTHPNRDIPEQTIAQIRQRTRDLYALPSIPTESRLTTEHVAKVISKIGEQARIVVQQPDEEQGRRVKYASAHDLRRGCAYRLINAGVSAETLKIILRHDDFKTTERFYGAIREAQSAAQELSAKLNNAHKQKDSSKLESLNSEQIRKLQALLESL